MGKQLTLKSSCMGCGTLLLHLVTIPKGSELFCYTVVGGHAPASDSALLCLCGATTSLVMEVTS